MTTGRINQVAVVWRDRRGLTRLRSGDALWTDLTPVRTGRRVFYLLTTDDNGTNRRRRAVARRDETLFTVRFPSTLYEVGMCKTVECLT